MTTSRPENTPVRIAIVGGGICGLIFALGLLKRGVDFHIYEASPSINELGLGIAFGPNGIAAMKLTAPSAYTIFKNMVTKNRVRGEENTWYHLRHGEGTHSGELFTCVKTSDEDQTGMSTVHRGKFLLALAELIPEGKITFGAKVKDFHEMPDGRVDLHFESGECRVIDAVAGCDGIRSRVREAMFGSEYNARFAGKYIYRGLIPMKEAVAKLGSELTSTSQMYLGHGGFVLTYEIEHGDILNVGAGINCQTWGHATWTLKNQAVQMKRDFKHWDGPARDVVMMLDNVDCFAIFDHPPIPSYYQGRIALLGDSAQASTPYQGAGVSQGIEDALILSTLLGDLSKDDRGGIEEVFKVYDEMRRLRSQKVVTTSREAGDIYTLEGRDGDDYEKVKEGLLGRYDWIWDVDLDDEVKKARNLVSRRDEEI